MKSIYHSKKALFREKVVGNLPLILFVAFMSMATSLHAQLELTILHNNDAESQLINAGSGALADFGGVARFKTLVDTLRARADASGRHALMLSSGDNFLAGPEFNASLQLPGTDRYYDAIPPSPQSWIVLFLIVTLLADSSFFVSIQRLASEMSMLSNMMLSAPFNLITAVELIARRIF